VINPKAAKRLRRGDNKPRTQTRNQLQAAPPTAPTPDFLVPDLQHSIARLDARIEHLRQQTRVLIDTGEPLQDTSKLLISITGIADASAVQPLYLRITLYMPALDAVRQIPIHGLILA